MGSVHQRLDGVVGHVRYCDRKNDGETESAGLELAERHIGGHR